LTGDHVPVIKRRNERHAATLGDLLRNSVAVVRIDEHDLRSERLHRRDLHRRRDLRHHDSGRHAELTRGVRDGPAMVAGRVGDNPAFTDIGR
jgi:hypothetical protein